mmetsp:Transcript_26406/g.47618  ORF Transcript_26406/g.47618 Transcript_26406/m.47618 type:complete len:109 (+) Transcript_26406:1866-2192(+)
MLSRRLADVWTRCEHGCPSPAAQSAQGVKRRMEPTAHWLLGARVRKAHEGRRCICGALSFYFTGATPPRWVEEAQALVSPPLKGLLLEALMVTLLTWDALPASRGSDR